ncbi:LOW QUALITY PROTEIN: asparagine synthetase domain-containing protein 1-like [Bolinopsis microptera]|uniref:LOW QUALITY PROTEIN: asparagine synthetase domain-containing protein 1-like n=1 Tax=Bolinopsis microptera TaxID=2820187 RepID=UPI00307A748F
MCGISCSYKCKAPGNKRLLNRGPDHQCSSSLNDVVLNAYILYVQGACKQPCSRDGCHLIYNGQIFQYPQSYESDTEYLLDLVTKDDVPSAASCILGPSTAIMYDENKRNLWFWRDYFGRRSLLISRQEVGYVLSSVGDAENDWLEVPAGGVFCLSDSNLTCFPFDGREEQCQTFGTTLFESVFISEETIPCPVSPLNTSFGPPEELDWESTCSIFLELLCESVRLRDECCKLPLSFTKDSLSDYTARHCFCTSDVKCNVHGIETGGSPTLELLFFSGGIDCTVLAALLHRSVPSCEPIDLLNVSFGNCDKTPDRISAIASLQDLQTIAPDRTWNLIKVDVSVEELQRAREHHIRDLLYPHNTVIDDSIGCALWFAARGAGLCQDDHMISSARLLFSGIGADELMGGYSRHRGAWQNGGGLEGVLREIQLDIGRISERNLGRDNRVIGDHMRDCVAPFLDESFVSYLNPLPIQYKVDFTLPRGQGEKIILRKVAQTLGLATSSVLPKKAIQFGSKIAKLEGKKEKGGDVCRRLTKKG